LLPTHNRDALAHHGYFIFIRQVKAFCGILFLMNPHTEAAQNPSLRAPTLAEKRHTLAHLLAAAVLERFPHAKPTIGPAVENGFYYDFDFSLPFDTGEPTINPETGENAKKKTEGVNETDLIAIEETMRELLPSWTDMHGVEVSEKDARARFASNPFKLELIDEITAQGEKSTPFSASTSAPAKLSLYTAGDFTDLCRGGHAEHPAHDIAADSFKLERIAGAYWRGDENKQMLTRIYGLAFENKEALDAYLVQQEEAKKRDHRKLGRELDLFTFSDLVGSGLPLFTPRGTILREEINTFSQKLRLARGFKKVWIPHITKTDLYKTSGHWDKFGDELFLVKSQETTDEFVMKPMNCPHHLQIYASQPRSYRDLPLRYLETTTVYRDEKKGELSGLSRVRSITQDDSHVICRADQIEDEYRAIMEMVVEFYKVMGMKFRARLSFRDSQNPQKYLGEDSLWEMAQEKLESIAKSGGFEYFIAEGEAAFYGPKIDFMATDAIGREHQLATGQLDFVQPTRFGSSYIDSDGSERTPVMIHLAIAGSLERFLSVYIEHTAGAFPTWLAPEQVRVLPISDKHSAYGMTVLAALRAKDVRAELDSSSESLGKKIREAKMQKIPYLLVVGDKEIEEKKVSVESRDHGKLDSMSVEDFTGKILEEISERK
jgi:threonyl-tRNA synthetase